MTRVVVHVAQGPRACSCGGKFKTPGELRKHIAKKSGVAVKR